MLKYSIFLLFALVLSVSGCSKPHPEIPAERNELVKRYFISLRNGDVQSALAQGEKIYMLDQHNSFMRKLNEIQQANNYLKEAQKALDGRNVERALSILDDGLKAYPSNRELTRHADIVRKIRHAGVYFTAMRNAPNAAAMNSALIAARAGLSGVESRRLKALFDAYERKIQKIRQGKGRAAKTTPEEKIQIRSFDDK